MSNSRVSRVEFPARMIARALALFFGTFTLINFIGGYLRPGFNANLWWVDLRAVPEFAATAFLLVMAFCLISLGVSPPRSVWRRVLTGGCVGLVAAVAIWNTVEFYFLIRHGRLRPFIPIPLSLFVLGAMMLILWMILRRTHAPVSMRAAFGMSAMLVICLICFPIVQMVCFGKTDYRRQADVAVVFGARTYADGRPSDALADRVRTACQLYHDGTVRKLIFSGGPGDGVVHETESMRRMAIRLGVKPEDILVDTAGLNTRATVKNTEALFAQLHAQRILVVSHFYHLPRIKLAYQQTGREVYTVPARESYFLRQIPYSMAREIPAIWVYYLHPLLSSLPT
ncbi:MAG: hypothetical protein JWR19_3567 [Pedosphaera sp.]|nr:hypothetical protein [Pedosphaera sp.]